MQRSSVDLPEPDGPSRQTTSPVPTRSEIHQHLEVAEALVHVLGRDHRAAHAANRRST